MRGIVGLFVIGIIGAGVTVYFTKKMGEETERPMAIAFGDPYNGEIEFNMAVELGMVRLDGPRIDQNGNTLWHE